ncbi:serine/threonine protein kinase [Saprolegnia parasitica CBS 223.65]|uniref:Serine/threonine protein kinase n=1 Tax=Saprolegnia parasitica (strain CBS 223.65) TaxID=695850 RepID=A0A067C089_SAPPC|nr:serine/threonine protein kinase [Saprolegnia parasitica CBS 223.65]KDO19991.1 serine/threonine protein kinase [Saprolegnia parasitica CBS 223.65]|eukprot:XP_012209294.1 serine/threonine protein kinase [Saprolegnia parasitica CBS 223.65]
MSALAIVANLIVPGAGLAIHYLPQIATFLAGINGRCGQLSQNQAHFGRVRDRLHEIFTQLSTMEARGQLPSPVVVKRFRELLEDFDTYLAHYLRCNFVTRLLTQDHVATKIAVYHNEVDSLLKLLDLAHIAQMTDWRLQYDADQREEVARWTDLVATNKLVLEACSDASAQRETMLRLLHALQHDKHTQSSSSFQAKLVKQAFHTLQRLSKDVRGTSSVPLWFVPPEDVALSPQPFARGATSDVFLGVWRQRTKVVVKVYRAGGDDVENELHLWASLRHPNLVAFYGGCHVGAKPFALCEEAPGGALDDYLMRHAGAVDETQLLGFLLDIAIALEYMHGNGVVHGDLKCNNVLLTLSPLRAQLSDFGCAVHNAHPHTMPTRVSAAIRWVAPECLVHAAPPSRASDVYALGMVLLEAVTLDIPFSDVDDDEMVRGRIARGELPTLDETSPYAVLVPRLCALSPDDRLDLSAFIRECEALRDGAPKTVSCPRPEPSWPTTELPLLSTTTVPLAIDVAPAATTTSLKEYGYGIAADKPRDIKAAKKAKHARRVSTRRLSISDVDAIVASQDVASLLQWLQRPTTSDLIKEKLLTALMPLAPASVAEHGGLELVLALAAKGSTPTIKELSTALLGLVVHRNAGLAATVRAQGGVAILLKILRQGTYGQRAFALRALAHLTSMDDDAIGQVLDDATSVTTVLDMLRVGGDRQRQDALVVAFVVTQTRIHAKTPEMTSLLVQSLGLLAFASDAYATRIADAGAIPLLWKAYSAWPHLGNVVLQTLANLATTDASRRQIARHHSIQHTIDAVLDPVSMTSAMHLLHNLSLEPSVIEYMVSLGAVNVTMTALLKHSELAMLGAKLLAQLSMASARDPLVSSGAVAWTLEQLRTQRDVDVTPLWICLSNAVVAPSCLDAWVRLGGAPLLIKRLEKASVDHVAPILQLVLRVATSLETVLLLVQHDTALYTLMNFVEASSSPLEVQLLALGCVAQITYFEPTVLRAVKGSGLGILAPLLKTSPHQALALRIVDHMTYCPTFHNLLTVEFPIVATLQKLTRNPALHPTCDAILTRLDVPLASSHKPSLLKAFTSKWRKAKPASNQDSDDEHRLVRALLQERPRGPALDRIYDAIAIDGQRSDALIDAGLLVPLAQRLHSKRDRSRALDVVRRLLDDASEAHQKAIAVDMIIKPLIAMAKEHDRPDDRDNAIQLALALATLCNMQTQVVDAILPHDARSSIAHSLLTHPS